MRQVFYLLIIPLFLLAPFMGLGASLVGFDEKAQALALPVQDINNEVNSLGESVFALRESARVMTDTIVEQEKEYQEQQRILQELASRSHEYKQDSDQIYEERILAMLGPPIDSYRSNRVEIKVFKLDELGYRGYIAKVKLFDPGAVKVVLGKDTLGQTETTSSAVARTGAILGINGGGFYSSVQGGRTRIMPIGNTVIDGKLVNRDFSPSNGDVFFAGIDRKGKMIGAGFTIKRVLWALTPGRSKFPPHPDREWTAAAGAEGMEDHQTAAHYHWRVCQRRFYNDCGGWTPIGLEFGSHPGTIADKTGRTGSEGRIQPGWRRLQHLCL